jgi:hypothetical protein
MTSVVCLSAASVTDYRSRIEAVLKDIGVVKSILDANETRDEYRQYIRRAVAGIRTALPESERIEFRGGSIETSNKWLRSKLDEFEKESDDNARTEIMSEIGERLSAIAVRIGELESAAEPARTKDEDKLKLAEILSREEYRKPEPKQESIFQRWLRKFLEWLSGIFPQPQIAPERSTGFGSLSLVLQIAVYVVVIGLLAFLIFKFGPQLARRFYRSRSEKTENRVILGETIDAATKASDLFAEAERLAREGDIRGAIRKGYVALLCDLADRKMIGLARHKTNRDYLRDVRKRRGLFERMKRATGRFERHWYGFRPAMQKDWEEFRDEYRKALSEG